MTSGKSKQEHQAPVCLLEQESYLPDGLLRLLRLPGTLSRSIECRRQHLER